MVNHIDVVAHGADGSFVRCVQHDPAIAVVLLCMLKLVVDAYDKCDGVDDYVQLSPKWTLGQVKDFLAKVSS